MDLIVIAQIITGLATLIVALVLVFQLRKQNEQINIQNKQLELQHKDTERDFITQFDTRFEDIQKNIYSNEDMASIWVRGSLSWENLKNDTERYRYRNIYRQIMRWGLSQYKFEKMGIMTINESLKKRQMRNMLAEKGMAHVYKNYYKPILEVSDVPEMLNLCNELYKEIWKEDISNFKPEYKSTFRF
tara:strand:+ start:165 stop:728 length:564 start_codon:yes stop_codon:yes gene_type:complete